MTGLEMLIILREIVVLVCAVALTVSLVRLCSAATRRLESRQDGGSPTPRRDLAQ